MTAPEEEKKELKPKDKKAEHFDDAIDFMMKNKADTIVYVLLFLGILTFIFNEMYGGVIVGVIAGFYFADDIIRLAKNANSYIDEQGIFRSFVVGGTALCLLIAAPFLFLGGAASAGMYFLATSVSRK